MEIIPLQKKLKEELLWAVKLIMTIQKYLKQIIIKESQITVVLDYNKTCDNMSQQNVGTE
jgi:hypothetical protein